MIVFGPGSSEIDITQKIGRVTRISFQTGKKQGIVLIPILVKKSSSSPSSSYKLLNHYNEQKYELVKKLVDILGGSHNINTQFSIVKESEHLIKKWVPSHFDENIWSPMEDNILLSLGKSCYGQWKFIANSLNNNKHVTGSLRSYSHCSRRFQMLITAEI